MTEESAFTSIIKSTIAEINAELDVLDATGEKPSSGVYERIMYNIGRIREGFDRLPYGLVKTVDGEFTALAARLAAYGNHQ